MSIKRATDVEALKQLTDNGNIGMQHDAEELLVELQPAEKGLQGQNLEADLVLWTVGNKPRLPELERPDMSQMLPLNGRGQAETDETLQVKGNPRIFALGDSSALRDSSGKLLPSTAQVRWPAGFWFCKVINNISILATYSLCSYSFIVVFPLPLHFAGSFPTSGFCGLEYMGSNQ